MFKKVLIPIDVAIKDEAQKLLVAAKTLTAGWDCELHVLTVVPDFGMAIVGSYFDEKFEDQTRGAVAEQLAAVVAQADMSVTQQVLMGSVYDSVIAHANNIGADLIVIGAHQPDLSDYLLGSNAARVVRHSKRSVLVLRDAP